MFDVDEVILQQFRCEDAISAEVRCGDGHCRSCNCSNWQPKSLDPNTCMCGHGYSDHDD
jgi:hypothetical protein